jgi:hypothetical protein
MKNETWIGLPANRTPFDDHCLHLDDRDLWHKIIDIYGSFPTYHKIVGEENGYTYLQHGTIEIRVKNKCIDDALKGLPPLSIFVGDLVILKKYPDKISRIIGIMWHHIQHDYIYILEVDGKRKTKWYKENDFVKKK